MNETETAIYELRKKAAGFLRVGDVEAFTRIQREISQLQQKVGAVIGTHRKGDNDVHTETN